MVNFKGLFISVIIVLFCTKAIQAQKKTELADVAKKHYTAKEIADLSETDIQKINYYYTASYSIDKQHPLYEKFIQEYCGGTIDVTKFEKYRKPDKPSEWRSEKYPGLVVKLASWNEINEKYKEIENKK